MYLQYSQPHRESFVLQGLVINKAYLACCPPSNSFFMSDNGSSPLQKVLSILPFRDGEEEVDWNFVIHFQEMIPVRAGSAEPAMAMPCRGPPEQWHFMDHCVHWAMLAVWPVRDWISGLWAEIYFQLAAQPPHFGLGRDGGQGIPETLNEEVTPW